MHIGGDEARAMSWQEYQARVTIHSRDIDPEGKNEPVDAPDAGMVADRQSRLASLGLVKVLH